MNVNMGLNMNVTTSLNMNNESRETIDIDDFKSEIELTKNKTNFTCDKYIKIQNTLLDKFFINKHIVCPIINLNDIGTLCIKEDLINTCRPSNNEECASRCPDFSYPDEKLVITKNIDNYDKNDEHRMLLQEINTIVNQLSTKLNTFNKLISKKKKYLQIISIDIEELRQKSVKIFKHLSNIEQNIHQLKNTSSINIDNLQDNFDKQKSAHIDFFLEIFFDKIKTYEQTSTEIYDIIDLYEISKRDNKVCTICVSDEVTRVVVPCGHTFCASCSDKMSSKCYICRQIVSKISNIYYQ